jgi:hypothetical protein
MNFDKYPVGIPLQPKTWPEKEKGDMKLHAIFGRSD